METYPVDLDAGQNRATEVREIPARQELHLGDEEREDLQEIATIATVEIAPFHAREG